MIIDLILDRKDDEQMHNDSVYNANDFYWNIRGYEDELDIDYISKAMDYGTNKDVQHALVTYLVDYGYYYDPALITWIKEKRWI